MKHATGKDSIFFDGERLFSARLCGYHEPLWFVVFWVRRDGWIDQFNPTMSAVKSWIRAGWVDAEDILLCSAGLG